MSSRKSRSRNFNGMAYRQVQRANSTRRSKLNKEHQNWLKRNGYKNTGWDNVIQLYQKIEEFLEQYQLENLSLEELFLEADRIGNKYLTSEETAEFNQQLAQEVSKVAETIDRQFPDTEIEAIDFSTKPVRSSRKPNQKTYRTVKL